MNSVFFGTPEIAIPTLRALAAEPELRPAAVFTQPPARRSRRGRATSSPVGVAARELGLEVHEAASVNEGEPLERLQALLPQVIVVVGFGQILKRVVLDLPEHGCLNFHPSMLPKYRGAAPVQRAVMDGVHDSGLTVMRLVRKLDAGPILLQKAWQIGSEKTAEELLVEAGELGAPMMLEVLKRLASGEELLGRKQRKAEATKAPPLLKSEGELDFNLAARAVVDRIRAVQPWPRATAWLAVEGGRRRLIVHRAILGEPQTGCSPGEIIAVSGQGIVVSCATGAVCLTEVQLEGRPRRPASDLAHGLRLKSGARFIAKEDGEEER